MSGEASLTEQLTACHHQLNELFLLHQEALLQGHLGNAASILSSYESCHALHMQFEDDILLPKYADLEKQGKWDATLYQQEHHKISGLYGKIEQGLKCMAGQSLDPSQLRRNIIHLLDREKSYKGLCEHHQEREETSLLVELDRQCDTRWRAEVGNLFSEKWKQKMALEMENVRVLL
jgi:hypothetical protein